MAKNIKQNTNKMSCWPQQHPEGSRTNILNAIRARINEELAKSNFVFFFKFHEKYTKNSTLVLIKERRSAF